MKRYGINRTLFASNFLLITAIMMLWIMASYSQCIAQDRATGEKIILAYVQSSKTTIPDPGIVTHIIYSFGEFGDDNSSIVIGDTTRLRAISDLKKGNPRLKVILGIGGPKREGFSEMASSKQSRRVFVKSCKRIIDEFNLDGIDLDWEFPTTENGGHTAASGDTKNYCKVVKELRKALSDTAWISFYSNNSGKWIDFKGMLPYVTYVNVSGYNLKMAPEHQSNLYSSRKCGSWSVAKSVERHIELGVPPSKILLGIPLFGRGMKPFPSYVECSNFGKYSKDCQFVWDSEAKASYYADADGNPVLGFDDEDAIKEKVRFIQNRGLAGAFYWHYDSDYSDHKLGKALYHGLKSE